MSEHKYKRRDFLKTVGLGVAAALPGCGGLLESGGQIKRPNFDACVKSLLRQRC